MGTWGRGEWETRRRGDAVTRGYGDALNRSQTLSPSPCLPLPASGFPLISYSQSIS
ncbi:hypothetical protein [Nostoc linckia]|uniref:hypothetical protein n=1 Tax=Nostoc linckia TaxID=92942 RepID=UPI0015D50081|nr:hypothetical protein [Nostoc linckia]